MKTSLSKKAADIVRRLYRLHQAVSAAEKVSAAVPPASTKSICPCRIVQLQERCLASSVC